MKNIKIFLSLSLIVLFSTCYSQTVQVVSTGTKAVSIDTTIASTVTNLASPILGSIWGTTGNLEPNGTVSALAKITVSAGQVYSIGGLTKQPTNYGRWITAGNVVTTITSADLYVQQDGYRITVPSNIVTMALNIPNTYINTVSVYLGNRVASKSLVKDVALNATFSDGEAQKYFELGKQDKSVGAYKMPAYILAGQSNQAGRVDLSELPSWWTANGNTITDVQILNNDIFTWHQYNSTDYDNPSGTSYWSYEILLLKKIIDYVKSVSGHSSDKIYAVKKALGGSSIQPTNDGGEGSGNWTPAFNKIPGQKLLQQLETRKRGADTTTEAMLYNLTGMIWHQGESDYGNKASGLYYQNMKNVIYYIRGVTGKPNLPVILGGINNSSTQYNATVEDAKKRLVSEDPYVFYATVANGTSTLKSDVLHFNAAGAEDLATSVYNIMIANKTLFGLP